MSQENAVAIRDDSPRSLIEELERRKSEARSLELKVARKEGELRKAQEEQALLKELRTVNEMIVKKKERQLSETDQKSQAPAQHSLKISSESLAELNSLENELKMESRKTDDLQDVANVYSRRMEDIEKALDEKSGQLAIVKRSTGYDVDARTAKGGSAALNEFIERKRVMTALEDEQRTLNETSDRLTAEIEELTRGIEEGEQLEEHILQAEEQLVEEQAAYAEACEKVKSCERLRQKKERMLDSERKVDDYKAIRLLEGDKRALHTNLTKLRDNNVTNTKSILALEVRLRQLETRLEAADLFLTQVFAEVEDDEPMEDVPEDATEVPLGQFEGLCRELELSRETVAQRDDQLMSHDALVEQLERKIGILNAAITSRTVSAQLHSRGKDKETQGLVSDMEYLRKDFEREHRRLVTENAELRKQIAQL